MGWGRGEKTVVTAERDSFAPGCRFVIQPNRSLSPRGLRLFFSVACSVSLAVAIACLLLGAWPVLPFAGVEILLLGVCLYLVARRAKDYEVVAIRDDRVEVRQGSLTKQERSCSFPRAWARASLQRHATGWYPSRLTIRSHGREVEVGRCLNEEERERLARDLSEFIVLNRVYRA